LTCEKNAFSCHVTYTRTQHLKCRRARKPANNNVLSREYSFLYFTYLS